MESRLSIDEELARIAQGEYPAHLAKLQCITRQSVCERLTEHARIPYKLARRYGAIQRAKDITQSVKTARSLPDIEQARIKASWEAIWATSHSPALRRHFLNQQRRIERKMAKILIKSVYCAKPEKGPDGGARQGD
jgi:hypothetical protein